LGRGNALDPDQLAANFFGHVLGIQEHVVIPESNHLVPHGRKVAGSTLIVAGTLDMLPAIDLDDQFDLGADEVGDVRTDRHLPAEAKTLDLAASQLLPELALGVGAFVS
jgi:hypothetical protein